MAQCKKKNDDGTRCSNPALPGSDSCERHRERLQFTRKAAATPPVEPSPAPPPAPTDPEVSTARDANAAGVVPTGRSDAPRLPDLRREERRGILVGSQALIRLAQPDRLTELLGGLSGVTTLDRGEVQRHAMHGDVIRVHPPDPQSGDLSSLYDRIASSVRFYEAEMYVGGELTFVRYRDREAPFGYDVPGKPGRKSRRLCLLGFGEPIALETGELATIAIRDLVLATAPAVSRRDAKHTGQIFVLCATELEKTFRRYFRSHHLTYWLTRIPGTPQQSGTLFKVEPSEAGTTVPAFVIAYLKSFPRCIVLGEAFQADRRSVLLEMGCTVAWNWPNTVGVFPEDCMLTVTHDRDFPNLCLDPAPTLISGDTLVQVAPKEIPPLKLEPLEHATPGACRFEIRFQHDQGPTTPPVAVLLGEDELRWLRRLLYRLPASEFSGYSVLEARPYSVLLAEQGSLREMPLGVAMKRVADSDLLIPCHLKLAPDLPSHLLAGALHAKTGKLTFVTEHFRFETERTDFIPLSALLHSPLNRAPIELAFEPAGPFPDFQWQMPEEFEEPAAPRERVPAAEAAQPRRASGPAEAVEMARLMQSKAANLRSADDPLGAALYLALAGDLGDSAELFRQQAAGLRSAGRASPGGMHERP